MNIKVSNGSKSAAVPASSQGANNLTGIGSKHTQAYTQDGDTARLTEAPAAPTYDFSSLPAEIWDRVNFYLIRNEPKAVVNLNATCNALRLNDAIRSDTITVSCRNRMLALRNHIITDSPDPYPFDAHFVNNALDTISSLSTRYRRMPLSKIVHLVNYDKSDNEQNIITSTHLRVFSEMKELDYIDVVPVVQPLLESIKYHEPELRELFFTKLLDFIENAELPHKFALYASASHGMLSLGNHDIPDHYARVKHNIFELSEEAQPLPLAHLARVIPMLDEESAKRELSHYKSLIDVKERPDTMYILHGLMRAPQKFTEDEQACLLHDANAALRQSVSIKQVFSNVAARVEFIALMSPGLRARALDESIDILSNLDLPKGKHYDDIYAWQFETLLPLAGTLKHCPESEEATDAIIKYLGVMRFKSNNKDARITYLDRAKDVTVGFDKAVEELFTAHATCLHREQPSE